MITNRAWILTFIGRASKVAALGALLLSVFGAPTPPVLATGPCSPPVVNPIVCENSLPGTPPSVWDVSGAGGTNIQGFATDISVNLGGAISFKVDTHASSYRLDIYRMGYYGGDGARFITTIYPFAPLPQVQPPCLTQTTTGLVDCGNWAVSASWIVPVSLVSGIYFAKLVRTDGVSGSSHIFFVVRNDASTSAILFKTSDTTWQAYNDYGGESLYSGGPAPWGAYMVSYNRPFNTRADSSQDFVFNAEYPMVRWLEANGYDVSYFSSVDADRYGSLMLNHKIILSVGHDEYWSGQERSNFEAARNAGVNLAFFSGNEVFWKTRWQPSIDGSNTSYRTIVCYKETHADAVIDPADPPTWTGTWRDPRFSPPADGGRPENALSGTIFMVNGNVNTQYSIAVPYVYSKLRFWRNTSVAQLQPGQTATFPAGTLGYEWDEDLDNGFRPAGLIDMSSNTISVPGLLLQDYGNTFGNGIATHHLTLYRAPSGALVFGAGTMQWSWGLDGNHDNGSSFTVPAMQQATVNLFADMGVQPGSLQPGLVSATRSTDTTPPTSTITSPANGSSFKVGDLVTISGKASDTGGVVAGVEVSVDGGTTWHPATGTNSWLYQWHVAVSGPTTIEARAVDDSGNIQNPATSTQVSVPYPTCPCAVGNTQAGASFDSGDSNNINGTRYVMGNAAGTVTSMSVYVGAVDSATHNQYQLAIYSDNNGNPSQLVAATTTGTLTPYSWNTLSMSATLQPNTAYWLVYNTNGTSNGVNDMAYVPSSQPELWTNNPVTFGSWPSTFPSWTQGQWSFSIYATYSTGGSGTPTATATATSTPSTSPTPTATATVSPCPCSLWSSSATPVHPSVNDPQPVELGVKFASSEPGYIKGIRFYKGSANTGPHVADLWSASGQLLAETGFTSETASGWQEANFTTPVAIQSGQVYIAAYHTASGNYAEDDGGFTVAVVNPPLMAPASGSSGGNGVYVYSSGNAFPNQTYNNANYWVDVVFTLVAPPTPTPTATATVSPCPCSLWSSSATPVHPSVNDPQPVELGVKFASSEPGYIKGIRFYKGSANTGPHVADLWSASGQLLAETGFTSETASGWQEANFTTPVAIQSGQVYIAAYHTASGNYAEDDGGFTVAVVNPPLTALASGSSGGNGVYVYSSGNAFPNQTYNNANYWVDVVFVTTP